MNNLNIRRGDTFINTLSQEKVVVYETTDKSTTFIDQNKGQSLLTSLFLKQYKKVKQDNYFYINNVVEVVFARDEVITSLEGYEITINKGTYINQINDIYIKSVEDLFYYDKRHYVFDFDTTGRDYVEYITDYSNLKLISDNN